MPQHFATACDRARIHPLLPRGECEAIDALPIAFAWRSVAASVARDVEVTIMRERAARRLLTHAALLLLR